ncbi:anthrone oxygenase family protein [Glaciibacter flavus]|uniref:anthrone oxygenase family protein n=1 Tax=Orlajensenia flava TaxID=2565934 RepID=UPI003AFFE626
METMPRLAALLMVVPTAIWAGAIFFYAVERVNLWARMPLDQYVVDFRRSLYRSDPLQPILGILAVIGCVVFALTTGGAASAWAWSGALLIVAVIVFSIALPERINSQFRRRPEGEVPPNAAELRRRWRLFHFIRTVPAIAAPLCVVLATTFA